jgi:hypothetical protein
MLSRPGGSGGREVRMPATDSVPASAASRHDDVLRVEPVTLTCPYCAEPIPAPAFRVWPLEPRLITGDCGGCGRSVTLPSIWLTTPSLVRQR